MLIMIRLLVRCIETVSPAWAAKLISILASMPRRYSRPPRELDQLAKATKLTYTNTKGKTNVAWSWGEGPKVLLAHGWESRGSQMATMAMAIAKAGYQAIAMDFSAHGDSPGKTVSFRLIVDDILSMQEQYGAFHAVVGHSAGGVMAMAARTEGLKANCYVVLGAPMAPYPALNAIQKLLKVRPKTLEHCKTLFAKQFDMDWATLEQGDIFRNGDAPLLLIYDSVDKEVPMSQGEAIHERWGQSQLIKTKGLGHLKLMWAPEVLNAVTRFIKQPLVRAA